MRKCQAITWTSSGQVFVGVFLFNDFVCWIQQPLLYGDVVFRRHMSSKWTPDALNGDMCNRQRTIHASVYTISSMFTMLWFEAPLDIHFTEWVLSICLSLSLFLPLYVSPSLPLSIYIIWYVIGLFAHIEYKSRESKANKNKVLSYYEKLWYRYNTYV